MTIAPTFHANMRALKVALRLSSLDAQQDADAQVGHAVREARVRFNAELGLTRVSTIQGYTSVDNPTTTEESLRALAEITETRVVKRILTDMLPMAFLDAAPVSQQLFQDQPPVADAGEQELRAVRKALDIEINEALAQLADTGLDRPVTTFKAIEPATAPTAPGATIHTST